MDTPQTSEEIPEVNRSYRAEFRDVLANHVAQGKHWLEGGKP